MAANMGSTNQASNNQFPKPKMPTLQRAFSKNSGRWQRITRLIVSAALVFISISAIASLWRAHASKILLLNYPVNFATGVAAIFFLVAGLIHLIRLIIRPERIWYGSRVLAERTRSLSWRYAVAGRPFPRTGVPPEESEAQYAEALNEAIQEADKGGIRYRNPSDEDTIRFMTEWMRTTRAQSLDDRLKTYAQDRISDQQSYYMKRARNYRRAAALFQVVLLLIEFTGALLTGLDALGKINLDLVGVAGTVAAGITAWVHFNQFTELASTYGAMAYRMQGYYERCLSTVAPWTESRWADFVGDVEDVLGEENGAWRRIIQQGATGNL